MNGAWGTGSGDAEYDRIRAWDKSRYGGSNGGGSGSAPDDGPGPTFNSIDGETLTPEVDNLYADHSLDRFDDSDVGDIGDFDPATENLADDSHYYDADADPESLMVPRAVSAAEAARFMGDVTDNG